MKGHVAVAKLLIEVGAHTDMKRFKEQITLHGQAPNEQVEALVEVETGRLINLVNRQDHVGRTALHYAVDCGLVEMLQLLLKNGGDIGISDSCGLTPWHVARHGIFRNATIELLLLEAFALSEGDHTSEDLYLAVARHDQSEVLRRIKAGFDINMRFLDADMPLHRVAEGDDEAMVKLLLDNGANVNARNHWGEVPVLRAVLHGKKHIVDLLLRHQPNLRLVDNVGVTALDAAVQLHY